MSFADQLRSAPDEKKAREEKQRKEEEKQRKDDFDKLIDAWYQHVKRYCMSAAEQGKTSTSSNLDYFVKDLETLPDKSGWLARIKPRITYRLRPKHDTITVCFTQEDAQYIKEEITKKLEKDGLAVNVSISQTEKFRLEEVYAEYSPGERLLNAFFNSDDSEGKYRTKEVSDGFRYKVSVGVTW